MSHLEFDRDVPKRRQISTTRYAITKSNPILDVLILSCFIFNSDFTDDGFVKRIYGYVYVCITLTKHLRASKLRKPVSLTIGYPWCWPSKKPFIEYSLYTRVWDSTIVGIFFCPKSKERWISHVFYSCLVVWVTSGWGWYRPKFQQGSRYVLKSVKILMVLVCVCNLTKKKACTSESEVSFVTILPPHVWSMVATI